MSWKDDIVRGITSADAMITEQQQIISGLNQMINERDAEIVALKKKIEDLTRPPPPPPIPELPEQGFARPTYHAVGLYWEPPEPYAKNTGVSIRIRERDSSEWLDYFDIHYDVRDLIDVETGQRFPKARGSIFDLKPDTHYVVQFSHKGQWVAQRSFKTWSEIVKIKTEIIRPNSNQPLMIQDSGSLTDGYVVYDGRGSVIDIDSAHDFCVQIKAQFVALRNFRLTGPRLGCVTMHPGCRDIIIESCDMSNWGTKAKTGRLGDYGHNEQAAVTNWIANTSTQWEKSRDVKRVTVQRNKIHDPRYGTNGWDEGHPEGPQGIYLRDTWGNHVLRYNELYASEDDPRIKNRYLNDAMGAGTNSGPWPGFPGNDSDIYQNSISHFMDDGIEAEGHSANARVWANRLSRGAAAHIATNVTHVGPIYQLRNIHYSGGRPGATGYPACYKTGDRTYGRGRRFFFHNTCVTPTFNRAIDDVNVTVDGVYARNNIWNIAGDRGAYAVEGADNSLDYNMTSTSRWGGPSGSEAHGILNARPKFKQGSNGDYQLAADSPGKGKAQSLPGINRGAGADIGAHDEGARPMTFGVNATTP